MFNLYESMKYNLGLFSNQLQFFVLSVLNLFKKIKNHKLIVH